MSKCKTLKVEDFWIAGPTDDTYMVQAAYNAVLAGSKKTLKHSRIYQISNSITVSNTVITGALYTGDGRTSAGFQMNANNIPMFIYNGQFMHSNRWEHLQFTYATMQTGNVNSVVFQINGALGSSFYNSVWEDCWSQNHYLFINSPIVNWWGNTIRDSIFGDFAGGITMVTSNGGEPNCRFERLYIACQSATLPLFYHNSVTAQFDNIEVNAATSGATMLYDGGGGNYTIGHWALEVGTYNSNEILFNVPNGTVRAKHVYTNTLTIGAGVTLVGIVCGGTKSYFDVDLWQVNNFAAIGAGGSFILGGASGPLASHFGKLDIPWATNVVPWDVSGTVSADNIIVDDWNDESRVTLNGDTSVSLAHDGAVHQIFSGLTALRTATLPEHRSLPANLQFSGWRRRILKSDTSAFALNVNNSLGTTLATIAAGTRGYVDVMWHREAPGGGWNWILLAVHTF